MISMKAAKQTDRAKKSSHKDVKALDASDKNLLIAALPKTVEKNKEVINTAKNQKGPCYEGGVSHSDKKPVRNVIHGCHQNQKFVHKRPERF